MILSQIAKLSVRRKQNGSEGHEYCNRHREDAGLGSHGAAD